MKRISHFLSDEMILEIMESWNPGLIAIGAIADRKRKVVTIFYGDMRSQDVKFSEFKPNAISKPDFTDIAIMDCGHTIQLGDYEAEVDHFIPNHARLLKRTRKAEKKRMRRRHGA